MTSPERGPGALFRLPAAALPAALGELSRPIAMLWCIGERRLLDGASDRHVAIVGTREASPYGVRTAERLAAACARAGLVVVSGLARGVDAAAHRAALGAGGATIGVQGTGADVPYPASHRALHAAVARGGLVISEMEPGTGATPGCFPRRNRIIAALCRVTLVVEAGYRSGAINTASHALDLGRTVAAVPGRVDEERAAGSNCLIRDGAQVITEVEDLLTLMGVSGNAGSAETAAKPLQAIGAPITAPSELRSAAMRRLESELSGRSIPDRWTGATGDQDDPEGEVR